MAWVTVLNPFKRLSPRRSRPFPSPFRALGWKLLGAYLLVMMSIAGLSNLLVYQFFAQNLYKNCDEGLKILADSASHSLTNILADPRQIDQPVHRPLDNDQDLDLSWQTLQQTEQSIEWFDAQGRLQGKSGADFPFYPLKPGLNIIQSPPLRMFTLPVRQKQSSALVGYVRVTELTEAEQQTLRRLQWGLFLGSLLALLLASIAGFWLTHLVLKPIKRSYFQLQQFTSDASHELRAPLTVIKTAAEVLQRDTQNEAREDQGKLRHILDSANQMKILVDDLLLLTRRDSFCQLENYILFPLDELLEDVVTWMEMIAEKKGVTLKSDLVNNLYVKGDPELLKRAFINLLDNAIKYTNPPGEIVLSLTAAPKFAQVTIQDDGIGIAPEQLPYIFDRFWQACAVRSPQQGGSGLGLSIVKSIIQTHRGQIDATSQLGKGATFKVKLPLVS